MNNNLAKVVVFQEDENALNFRYKLPFKLKDDISVKSYEYDLENFKNSGVKLIGPRPTEGSIYYLHPYKDNEYVHESKGEMYFLEEKLNLYRRVGALLGAKSITTNVTLKETEKLEVDAEGKITYKVVDASINVKSTKESEYKDTLEISESYELQNNYDLNKNIDSLRALIDKYNLHHELGITSLIDARDSKESGVSLTKRSVKSEISSEYRNLLEVSAQLKAPVFSVGMNFSKNFESVNKLVVDIEFVF